MNDMSAVVFAQGSYEYKNDIGTVTINVPRDVTLGDISPALTQLVRSASGEGRKVDHAA